jgi:hypothetical protein
VEDEKTKEKKKKKKDKPQTMSLEEFNAGKSSRSDGNVLQLMEFMTRLYLYMTFL